MLTQQRGRSALHDLGVTEAHIVPGHPHPSYDGMLVDGDHIIGRGVGVVEKDFTVSFDSWGAWDACLLQARQTCGQAQDGKALGEGLGQRRLCRMAPVGGSVGSRPTSSQSRARQRARRSACVSATT